MRLLTFKDTLLGRPIPNGPFTSRRRPVEIARTCLGRSLQEVAVDSSIGVARGTAAAASTRSSFANPFPPDPGGRLRLPPRRRQKRRASERITGFLRERGAGSPL